MAELRRRAEKDRDTASSKLERTKQELLDIAEQQAKLQKRADMLSVQQTEQETRVERLKQQVAGLAHDDAGNGPAAHDTAAERARQAKTATDAVKEASEAKAASAQMVADVSKATAAADQAIREAVQAVALANSGKGKEAEELLAKSKASAAEAHAAAKRAAQDEDIPDIFETGTESGKVKQARTA